MYAKEKIKQERSVGVNKFWSRVTTKKIFGDHSESLQAHNHGGWGLEGICPQNV